MGEVREPRDAVDIDLERPVLEPGDEVIAQRTETSKTFVGEEPGLFETRVFTEPVHVATDEGWVDVDTELVGEGGRWVPQTSPVGVSLAGDAEDESLAQVDLEDGVSVGWGWSGAADAARASAPEKSLMAAASEGAGEGVVDGDTVTYEDVTDGVSMQLSPTATGVKEDLVLDDAQVPGVFFFDLDVDGASVVEAGGGVHFLDEAGEVVGVIPAGFMEDAEGQVSDDVTIEVVGSQDAPRLKVSIDTDWLQEDGRVFPVRVDPTVTFTSGVVDTHVESDRPTTNFSGYSFMRVGKQPNGKIGRGFVRFDLSSLSGKTIDYAQLRLNNRTSIDCTPRKVTAHRVTQSWSTVGMTYPGPGFADIPAGDVTIGAGASGCDMEQARIWVSGVVRDWASGEVDNHGFMLKGNEQDTSSLKYLDTSEFSDPARRPQLVVSWRESMLGSLGYYTMSTQQLTDRTQMSVNLSNGNLFVQGADVSLAGVAGMGLSVNRFYNSREDAVNPARAGQTGTGWTLDVGSDIRLSVNGYDEEAFFEGPSGYRITFPYNRADQEYGKPVGLNAELTRSGNDYTVHLVDSVNRPGFGGGS
ncbi:putative large secreted protein [Serinicoccus hydrothermalis]|uniref:Putative large secreted protein n=1 Tax=Serinicoccus hydrothermalis TaxID=1758689 RepID=A0A1B1NE24_9MICO|nr:putative large secreted protein [Serinicoccus hydrothermalis]